LLSSLNNKHMQDRLTAVRLESYFDLAFTGG